MTTHFSSATFRAAIYSLRGDAMTVFSSCKRIHCLLLAGFLIPALGLAEEAVMPPRATLLEKELKLASPKATIKVYQITFPKGFKTPPHIHEGPGPRYVQKGRVRIEEEGTHKEYGPGQVFWETGEVMTAENVSDGEAELIIFEIIPEKDPLAQKKH